MNDEMRITKLKRGLRAILTLAFTLLKEIIAPEGIEQTGSRAIGYRAKQMFGTKTIPENLCYLNFDLSDLLDVNLNDLIG